MFRWKIYPFRADSASKIKDATNVNRWSLYLLILIIPVLLLAGCKFFPSKTTKQANKPVNLVYWRVTGQDEQKDLAAIISDYISNHPQVSINVKYVRAEEFDQKLLYACATHNCPDIISLPIAKLHSWVDLLSPLPDKVEVPYVTIEGWKKDQVVHLGVTKSPMPSQLDKLFTDTVARDVVIDGKIYGLPLALDTIVMYYNKDLLNKANISEVAQDWITFKEQAAKISLVDRKGNFIQHAAALGEADNIPLAFELLSALMMQNGTPMTNEQGTRATFDQEISVGGERFVPGEDALRFYLDFSNPIKEVYSWSAEETSAQDAFIAGRLAYYFDYFSEYKKIKELAPRLNIGITSFPQISLQSQPVYYADYYVEAVQIDSQAKQEAWDFILFATTKKEENTKYLESSGKLTALRSQIDKQKEDFELEPGAKQLLNAKTWYRGYDIAATKQAFLSMIRQAKSGTHLIDALSLATRQVNITFSKLR